MPSNEVGTGETITIGSTIANLGTADTTISTYIGYFISSDEIITLEDTKIGEHVVNNVAAGNSVNVSKAVTVPATTAPGTYYIGVIADIRNAQPEVNETNNALVATTAVQISRNVDLTVTALTPSSTDVSNGETISLLTTVTNLGSSELSAPYFYLGFYISTDPEISTADQKVGEQIVFDIAGNETIEVSSNAKLPGNLAPGTYYIGAVADFLDLQPELDETNNSFTSSTPLVVSLEIDLIVSSINTPDTSVNTGGAITIDHTIHNQGGAATDSYTYAGIYLSTDDNITINDRQIGTSYTHNIDAGGSYSATNTFNIPTSLTPGTYYLGVVADHGNWELESDESNNALAFSTPIQIYQDVDLVMTSVSTTDSQVNPGGTITVDHTIQNQGSVSTTGYPYVGIYLSADADITTADTLIGTRFVGNLSAGVSQSFSDTATIPAGLTSGTYYLGVIADHTARQMESNEDNNVLLASGTLEVMTNVDLVATELTLSSISANVGDSITLSSTFVNQGNSSTTSSNKSVTFYLSTDAVIDSSDRYIGSRIFYTVSPGEVNSADQVVSIPTNLAAGNYYVGMIVDGSNTQPETDETNNTLVANETLEVIVHVDLVPTELALSSTTANVGETITLSNTFANQGTSSTTVYGNKSVLFYLSTDAVIDSSDRHIGSRIFYNMSAGEINSADQVVSIPTNLAAGNYYVGMIVDGSNTQPETDETNNTLVANETLEVIVHVDLVPTELALSSTTANVGETITLNNTFANQGTSSTTVYGNKSVLFYLSTDAVIDSSDRHIGSRIFYSMSAGEINSADQVVSIPTNLAAGSYYVGMIVDGSNTQPETDETNNTLVANDMLVVVDVN